MDNQVKPNDHQQTVGVPSTENGGAVKKYIGVIFEPSKAFKAIKSKPNFIFPLVIMMLLIGVKTYISLPYQQQIELYSQKLMGMSADHPALQNIQAQSLGTTILNAVVGIALIVLGWLVMAGIARLFSMLFAGKGKFKQNLSVFANVYVFTLIGAVLSTVLLVVTGSPEKMNTNLSVLFPFLEETSFLFWIFNSINIFTLWGIIVAVIGISIVEDIKKFQACLIVVFPWLLSKILLAAYIALFVIPMLDKIG